MGRFSTVLGCCLFLSLLMAGCSDSEARKKQWQAAESLGVPLNDTLDLGKGVTMELVLIPAGNFLMGREFSAAKMAQKYGGLKVEYALEQPQHQVTISKPFYMSVTEVTQSQWKAVMGTAPSIFKGASNPVENVSWYDALAFCEILSKKIGRPVRLPIEAEWEYACRAGTTTPFYTGETMSMDQANYGGVRMDDNGPPGRDKTVVVGSFKPNAWGLYDMAGNVWEWCAKHRSHSYEKADTSPSSDSSHHLRGGSWFNLLRHCRSAYSNFLPSDYRTDDAGFRVVVSAGGVD